MTFGGISITSTPNSLCSSKLRNSYPPPGQRISYSSMSFHLIDLHQVGPPPDSLTIGSSTAGLGSRIAQWNSALPQYARQFSRNHSDISVGVYDVHTFFVSVLNNPTAYGFKDAISVCHTSDCIWADDVHSTFAMQKLIATDLLKFLGNSTIADYTSGSVARYSSNMPFKLLVFGVVLYLMPRYRRRKGRRQIDTELGFHKYKEKL